MKNISAVYDSKDIVTVEYLDNVTAAADKSDSFTINNTVNYPLLALTAYGRSTQGYASHGGEPFPIENIGDGGSLTVTSQDGTAINIADVGIEGYGIPVSSGGNYTDKNGQQWVCDELIVNADGTGKIVKNISKSKLSSANNWLASSATTSVDRYYASLPVLPDCNANVKPYCTHFNQNVSGNIVNGISINNTSIGFAYATYGTTTVDDFKKFLDVNDVYVIYALITPTETELTSEQLTALQTLIDKYGAFTAYFMSTQDGTPTPKNPVEIVSTTDLYRTKTATIATGLPLRGIPVSNGGNYTDANGQEWVCDTVEYNYTEAVKIQRIAVIDSYNGEKVGDTYISTTGGLDVGVSVIYPAETVTETPLTADEINQLRNLETFGGVTNIYNSGNANMSVEYMTSKAVSKAVMPIITVLRGNSNA